MTAKLEDVALRWLRDVLGLPPETGVGFVTGATMAISAAYLPASPTRDPSNFTPELSRRALRVVREVTEDPEQRLLDMAEAYRNFAMSNLELYQVMNDLGVCLLVASKKPPAARESFDITQEALVDWAKVKGVDIPDVGGAVEIIRSLVHGLISLTMVDRIFGGEPRAKELLQRAMRDMFAAWSAGQ